MYQLNLPHGPNNLKVENRKTKKYKTDVLRSIGKQFGEYVESVLKKTRSSAIAE